MKKTVLILAILTILACGIIGCDVGSSYNDIDINGMEQLEKWIELYNQGLE